ncbi:MAG: type III-B CRISPR-associated protein Cas10/Cmr2 [Thiothrix sp.]|uniref:type III-B CRISPR-associated protein Cas10/Cmr2 n=1 Tax=Thiothrix sp. TaxID=1032 RepID=UPI002601807E|nr:type III-B CRISPR-associated protein Cas10/Cmr2 [Thiothrix sp.]MDD5392736.1 type III-B CRISPR-associated protein Cas10/Cmr2 [Thiothrix sp.]
MSNNTHYFHFTLGPVQGFVSQARRTRDFWAGSFILSWLAAVAIQAVKHQKGEIQFPNADDNYMGWLTGKGEKGTEPKQGSIPNRFKSLVAAVDPKTFEPEQVAAAVQEAWQALATEVWAQDLGLGSDTPANTIWEQQIANFWDMSWVITADKSDSAALDKRKNWRSYTPPKEPGVKCAMMEGWQELSGEPSPNRADMNKFWNSVRANGRYGMKSDLAENEALCAIAFVKRRFSRHFAKLQHSMKQGWQLKGWEVPSAVPSVTYMAAVHWLEATLNNADSHILQNFHDAAAELTGMEYGEWATNIHCLERLPNAKDFKRLRSLDGNVFFSNMLENKNIFADQVQAKRVQIALSAISKSAKSDPVSPFYAILLMDGDSLGSHMSDLGKQGQITNGLAKFTKGVPPIIEKHNGFLIYAGGDDVLAILPLEDAIPCATELRSHYMGCFDRKQIPTTLSGAIEFVHIKTPLTKVLKDAHHLLDEVAKDGRGRDALAIRVWKPGGLQIEWAQPWEIALNPQTDKTYLEEIADSFQNIKDDKEQFSSKFFYKIRERFNLLNPDAKTGEDSILQSEAALSLMAMEYLNSGKSDLKTMDQASDRIRPLMIQCRPVTRDKDETDNKKWKRSKRLEADGALLVRFLSQKGVER